MAMEQRKTGNAFVDAQDMEAGADMLGKIVHEECAGDAKVEKAVTIIICAVSGANSELRPQVFEGVAVGLAELCDLDAHKLVVIGERVLTRMLAHASKLHDAYTEAQSVVAGMTRQ